MPGVKRHWRQSPAVGVEAAEVILMGLAGVPTACSAPYFKVKLAAGAICTVTPGSMLKVALLSRTTSPWKV